MAYFDKYGVEFSDDRKTLIKCPRDFEGAYSIPSNVLIVNNRAFYKSSLNTISIPDSVIEIGEEAFAECNLRSVYIPSSVKNISRRAFFNNCVLESIYLSEGIEIIGEEAFAANETYKSFHMLEIPSSVKKIGRHAFDRCMYYEEDYICEGSTVIDRIPAHSNDENELDIIILNSDLVHAWPKVKLETVILKEGVSTIPPYAFAYSEKLRNVILPSSLKSIREFAFWECPSLRTIVIPSDIDLWITSLPLNIQTIIVPDGKIMLKLFERSEKRYNDLIRNKVFVDLKGKPIIPELRIFKIGKESNQGTYYWEGNLYELTEVDKFEDPKAVEEYI